MASGHDAAVPLRGRYENETYGQSIKCGSCLLHVAGSIRNMSIVQCFSDLMYETSDMQNVAFVAKVPPNENEKDSI